MLDLLGGRALLVLIDKDLNHRLEGGGVEELIIELAVMDVEGQRTAFHNSLVADLHAARTLLQISDSLFNLLNPLVEILDVARDELNVVLAVTECLHLHVEELVLADCTITIHVHVVEYLFNSLRLVFLADLFCFKIHELFEFLPRKCLVVINIVFVESFLKILLKRLVVLPPHRFHLILVLGNFSLSLQHLVWVDPLRAVGVTTVHCH